MIEEILLLNSKNQVILGKGIENEMIYPLEQVKEEKILLTKKIDSIVLAIIFDKFSFDAIDTIKKIADNLPQSLDEKIVYKNYFKYFFIFEKLKVKFNVKENNQIVPIGNILKIRENVMFKEKEFFIDVIEKINCILDLDLNVYKCEIYGDISYKSYVGNPVEMQVQFESNEAIKFLGNPCFAQNADESSFHLRIGDGVNRLCSYVVDDVNPIIFIKKTTDGYELLPKHKLFDVEIKIPVHKTAFKVDTSVSIGNTKYQDDCVIWNIPKLEDLGAKISVKIYSLEKEDISSSIQVNFKNKFSKFTQLRIKGIKVKDIKISSYAKHVSYSDNYEVRMV